jgi:phosphoribosylglycinamide formyltransferase 1
MNRPIVRLGVLASGRGSNLRAIIEASRAEMIQADVAVVISDRHQSQALEQASRHNISTIHLDPKKYETREEYDTAVVRQLQDHHVDLVILAGYMRLITARLIGTYKNRIINIHPSLLPSFPGLHAQRQALEWGARISGCTVHLVDETMDQGPIIIQAAVPVMDGDTEGTLEARILEEEHRILPQAIQFFVENRLEILGRRVSIQTAKDNVGSKIISPMLEISL